MSKHERLPKDSTKSETAEHRRMKFFKDMAQNTNLSFSFHNVLLHLVSDPLLGFWSGSGCEVGFVILGGKVCQVQVNMEGMDNCERRVLDEKGIESNIYVLRPYFRIVDCPACWISYKWEEWCKIIGNGGFEHHRGHTKYPSIEKVGRQASNRWLKSRGLPENGQRLYFVTRGIQRVTCLKFQNASNTD